MKTLYLFTDNIWKKFCYHTFNDLKDEFTKRNITIGDSAVIGNNAKIGDKAKIGDNAKIGNEAIIGSYAKIGNKAKIGKYAEIGVNL